MLELFRTIPPESIGVLRPPAWNFVQAGIQRNIQRIQQYHYAIPKPVKSSHFLIRLLGSIAVPKTLPLERYYANVDAIALNVSMALRMTSSISRGALFKGIFYGTSTPEILLATDDFFDFEQVHCHWRTTSAVTPLLHGKSDLHFHLPTGVDTSLEDSLSIILVNVPMLAVQYRAFLLEQQQSSVSAAQTVNQFIGGYVLPNMLKAHAELCLFNRIRQASLGALPRTNESLRVHPFALPSYTSLVDAGVQKAISYIQKSDLNFNTILHSLPSFYHHSLYPSLLMPDIAPTRQCDWVLVLARLKVLNLLFTLSGDQLLSKNQYSINQVLRAIRDNDVYANLRDNLPHDLFFEAQDFIDQLLIRLK